MFEEDISDIKDLSDKDKTRLMEDFDKVMEEVVVPEFNECGQRFKALSGTAVNEKGLAGFPHGKELFEHMIRKEVGRNCDIGKIASGIDSILKEETKDPGMSNIPAGSNQELLDFMEDAADEYFPDIKISYKINKLPRLFKAVGIGGVYYSANYDNNSCERIYLPDEMRQKQVIFHEGVPGHMYQFSYHKNNLDHIYPVLFEQGIYAEGWATYIMCNPAPLYKADMDEDIVYPAPVYKDRMLAARADICLNYEGLSAKETEQYLTGLMGTFSGGLDGVISDPGGSSAYGVGCYGTLKTLEAIKALDPDMSLKTMHKLYLDAGPGCFDRILASCAREVNRQP